MRLNLLRHGAAVTAVPGSSDAARTLSEAGRTSLKSVLEQAKAAGLQPAVMISSPYTRAIQSAEIAAEVLGYKGIIEQSPALEPDRSSLALWDEIRLRKDDGEILLVGHQPLLGELAIFLLKRSVAIHPATLVRIDIATPAAEPQGALLQILEG
jgi:phosphohistidine phosphatase